jgi:hypothetical protein
MLVEMRQFPGATCSRAAPSKTRDLHACQYHHHQGNARRRPRMLILFCRIQGYCAVARLGDRRRADPGWACRARSGPAQLVRSFGPAVSAVIIEHLR